MCLVELDEASMMVELIYELLSHLHGLWLFDEICCFEAKIYHLKDS